jgi:hypothetical protein
VKSWLGVIDRKAARPATPNDRDRKSAAGVISLRGLCQSRFRDIEGVSKVGGSGPESSFTRRSHNSHNNGALLHFTFGALGESRLDEGSSQ